VIAVIALRLVRTGPRGSVAPADLSATVTPDGPSDALETIAEWEKPHGRWHIGDWREVPFDEQMSLTPEQEAEIERLKSIGYLSGSQPVPLLSGVTVYDRSRAQDGLNFYTTGDAPGAVLMDMEGRVLHKWAYTYMSAWKQSSRPKLRVSAKGSGFWRRAYLFGNGDVLAVFDGLAIIKVDKDSRLLWANLGGFHHDLDVMDDGSIYVLTREAHIVPRYNPEHAILEDYVAVLDQRGEEIRRVSILEALESSEYAQVLELAGESGDIFHTNTVEVLDGRLADEIPAFQKGFVLVTIRELDLIAVIDMAKESVVWAMTGDWAAPHQATILENGNMMVFDNRGNKGASGVVELDLVAGKTVWVYSGRNPADFRSGECGSSMRLPNGNTLITETDRGKAFEVTPDGAIVWKYVNPAQTGQKREYIASLFEVIRLPADFPIDWARWR
jgi:hypothetical protein